MVRYEVFVLGSRSSVISYQPFSPFSPLSYCTKATENVIPELIFLDKLLHF